MGAEPEGALAVVDAHNGDVNAGKFNSWEKKKEWLSAIGVEMILAIDTIVLIGLLQTGGMS